MFASKLARAMNSDIDKFEGAIADLHSDIVRVQNTINHQLEQYNRLLEIANTMAMNNSVLSAMLFSTSTPEVKNPSEEEVLASIDDTDTKNLYLAISLGVTGLISFGIRKLLAADLKTLLKMPTYAEQYIRNRVMGPRATQTAVTVRRSSSSSLSLAIEMQPTQFSEVATNAAREITGTQPAHTRIMDQSDIRAAEQLSRGKLKYRIGASVAGLLLIGGTEVLLAFILGEKQAAALKNRKEEIETVLSNLEQSSKDIATLLTYVNTVIVESIKAYNVIHQSLVSYLPVESADTVFPEEVTYENLEHVQFSQGKLLMAFSKMLGVFSTFASATEGLTDAMIAALYDTTEEQIEAYRKLYAEIQSGINPFHAEMAQAVTAIRALIASHNASVDGETTSTDKGLTAGSALTLEPLTRTEAADAKFEEVADSVAP